MRVQLSQLPHPSMPDRNVPLAACYLKAAATAAGLAETVDISIVSGRFANHSGLNALARSIVSEAPDVLGLSIYLWNTEVSMALARAVKNQSPRTRIVVGGPDVTPYSETILADPAIDIAVFGEGEIPFVSILGELLAGSLSTPPPGTACRINRVLTIGPPAREKVDLSTLPSPILSGYLDLEEYDDLLLFSMRGCIQGCSYCAWSGRGHLRVFPLEQLKAEIRLLHEHAQVHGRRRLVSIVDSAFNTSPLFTELCKAIAEINTDGMLQFRCFLLAERLDDQAADLLHRANFTSVEVGLQSTNVDALRTVGRPLNTERFLNGVEVLRRAGIAFVADAIIGLPGDDLAGFSRTMRFLDDNHIDGMYFNLSLGHGAPLRKSAKRLGLNFQNSPPYYVIGTPSFPLNDLTAAMKRVGCRTADLDMIDDLQFPIPLKHIPIEHRMRLENGGPGPQLPVSHIRFDSGITRSSWEACVELCSHWCGNQVTLDLPLSILRANNECLEQGLRRIAEANPFTTWTTLVRMDEDDQYSTAIAQEIDDCLRPRNRFLDRRSMLYADAAGIRRQSNVLLFIAPNEWPHCSQTDIPEALLVTIPVRHSDTVLNALESSRSTVCGVVLDVSDELTGNHILEMIESVCEVVDGKNISIFFEDWVLQRLWISRYHKRRDVKANHAELVVSKDGVYWLTVGERDLLLDAVVRRRLTRDTYHGQNSVEMIIDRCVARVRDDLKVGA